MWWWNEKVNKDITEKRGLWMLQKGGGRKDKYLDAKWKARHAVHRAKRNAEKEKTSFVSPNKCVHKIRMQLEGNVYKLMMVIFHLMTHQRR